MKRFSKVLLLCATVVSFLITSCAKDGEVGPKGDKGDTGATGIQGIKGDKGDDGADGADGTNGSNGANGTNGSQGQQGVQGVPGQDGNANVKSYYYSIWGLDWIQIDPYYYVNLNVPILSQEIIDYGVVLVYMIDSDVSIPLPYTEYSGDYDETQYSFMFGLNFLYVLVVDNDLIQTPNPGDTDFRVVVIQGTDGDAKSAIINSVKGKTYNEVMQMYNIKN